MSDQTHGWGRRSKNNDGLGSRVRTVLGTRGQRSHATRPTPEHAHQLPRVQPPPVC